MAEYIDRDAALRDWPLCDEPADAYQYIRSYPAADVRPVVRGRWEDAMQSCHDSPHVKCASCGEYYWRYFNKFNFCPNCGADMREER